MICFRRANTRNSARAYNVDFFRTIYGRPGKNMNIIGIVNAERDYFKGNNV
jgi:hypothetical protein